jgi:hypothetical protein
MVGACTTPVHAGGRGRVRAVGARLEIVGAFAHRHRLTAAGRLHEDRERQTEHDQAVANHRGTSPVEGLEGTGAATWLAPAPPRALICWSCISSS